MKTISIYLASSLMVIVFLVGVGVGYMVTPQYSMSMYDKTAMNLGQPDRWLDLRYLNAMIAHHRGAMLLAEQARKSQKPEIKNLAEDILKNEPAAIEELYSWKKEWYGDSRVVIDPVASRLGEYDATFDLRFINALIAHHQDGVLMTKDVKVKSSNAKVLDNAGAVENFLNGGIDMLKNWRKDWYSL